MKHRCVFLDRDGTINKEVSYLHRIEDIEIMKGVAKGIRMLNTHGYMVIVISNQSGVARGFFSTEEVEMINEKINELLLAEDAKITEFYYCPHHPNGIQKKYSVKCNCRKPNIGMIAGAVKKYDIDITASYLIGDKATDMKTARNAGCGDILVLTGYGRETMKELANPPLFTARSLDEAAEWIIKRNQNE